MMFPPSSEDDGRRILRSFVEQADYAIAEPGDEDVALWLVGR